MCDTFVVVEAGGVVFGKNSDREPDEAQALEIVPAADHAPGARVRCTYVDVPQVRRTHRVLLSRPYWMWGAEMGANEHGVVIGNEAVFTRAPVQDVGLLGMDLLRLALERASSAEQAVTVIGALLEEHGQGGVAGHRDPRMRYDSSYIIADPADAWVMETAGRLWVAERVRGVRAISNGLTIHERWDRASDRVKQPLDFARTFSRRAITFAAAAARRRGCTERYLSAHRGRVTPLVAMRALRRHGDDDDVARALRSPFMTVCAHASWWPTRRAGQTTASLVSRLAPGAPVHFATGTAAPCTSVFKPVDLAAVAFDTAGLWRRHERLHHAALRDLPAFLARFAPERDALEARFMDGTDTATAFEAADALEQRFLAESS